MNCSIASSSPVTPNRSGARFHDFGTMVGNTPVLWVSEPRAGPGGGFWGKRLGHNPHGV